MKLFAHESSSMSKASAPASIACNLPRREQLAIKSVRDCWTAVTLHDIHNFDGVLLPTNERAQYTCSVMIETRGLECHTCLFHIVAIGTQTHCRATKRLIAGNSVTISHWCTKFVPDNGVLTSTIPGTWLVLPLASGVLKQVVSLPKGKLLMKANISTDCTFLPSSDRTSMHWWISNKIHARPLVV
jgi:hypothetical protein